MDPKTLEPLMEVLAVLLTGLFTILTPIAVVLVRRLARHVEKLADVKLNENQLKQLDWAVEAGIRYAEEQARKRLLSPKPAGMPGAVKREVARVAARSLAPDGLHTHSDQQLDDFIDSRVNRLRPALIASNYPPPLSTPPPAVAIAPLPPVRITTHEETEPE